jgi:hypothetical protein
VGSEKNPRPAPSEARDALVLIEFEQAWLHYRQNETMRTQYLASLLLLVAGLATVGNSIATGDALKSPRSLLELSAIIFAFQIVVAVIFITVRRIGIVLVAYEAIWGRIRREVYGAGSDLITKFDVRYVFAASSAPKRSLGRLGRKALLGSKYSIQTWAEGLLLFFLLLGILGYVLIVVQMLSRRLLWTWSIPPALLAVMSAAFCMWLVRSVGFALFDIDEPKAA